MNPDFKQCLDNGKISLFPPGPQLFPREIEVAEYDLADARASAAEGRHKWAIIQAYYAMFHLARALLFSRGYREKSHHCLAVALRTLFVEEGKLDIPYVRDYLNAMNLREAADYQSEYSGEGARAVLAAADRFHAKVVEILQRENPA